MNKAQKKLWKRLIFRWILPLYIAWQCGYNMQNNKYLYKYMHESDLVHHYVKIMHDTHLQDMEMNHFTEAVWIQEVNKYIEMRDYARKLERKLKKNGNN